MHVYLHTPAQPKKQRKEFQNKTKPPAKPRKAYDDFGIQDPASISPNQIPFLHVFFKEKCFTPNFYPYYTKLILWLTTFVNLIRNW